MGKLTDKVAGGFFWVLLEKCGIQFAHFIVTLVLARLLTPNDYGTVALITVFVSFSNVLVDSGLPKALMQKKTAEQIDFDTVFYLTLSFAAILYCGLYFLAPFVAEFYGVAELSPMLRILAIGLIFHSVNGVQNVELARKMKFKLSFLISWPRVIVSSAVGVYLALRGYGAWALVWSSFAGGVTGVIARQLVVRWRPTLEFSWERAKGMFAYGWKMAVAALITDLYRNVYVFIIGKFYLRADLAFVRKGGHVPRVFMNFINQSLRRVSFPALVKMQDEHERLRNAMRRIITCSSFCVFPILATIALISEPLIYVLFGEKWLPAVPYARLACFSGMFGPFNAVNTQALTAQGRSGTYLKLVVIRRVMGLVIMACALPYGVFPFMVAVAFVLGPLGMIVTAMPNSRLLGYTLPMQFADVAPALLASVFSASVAAPCLLFSPHPVVTVLLVPALACVVYLLVAYWFRMRALKTIFDIIGPRIEKRFPMLNWLSDAVAHRCRKTEVAVK